MAHVLVVGAGLAGARSCSTLRAAGFDGRITLVGAELEGPYDRPPLSKGPHAQVDLRTAMGLDVWALADDVRLGVQARGLTAGAGRPLVLSTSAAPDGDRIDVEADAIVVATGASPNRPPDWVGPGVHLLHTLREAEAFWVGAAPGARVAVVGGGWIGCEVAAAAALRGAHVELFEAADQVLPGRVPASVAERIADWVSDAGAMVHLASPVVDVEPGGAGVAVRTGTAQTRASSVLVALGVRPETAWLAGAGIDVSEEGAVLVDPWGRSSVPGVFAVGDAATRWSPRFARHLPWGHWTEALNAPEPLAAGVLAWLAGDRASDAWSADPGAPVPEAVPYVFSEIGGHLLQVLGDAGAAGDVLWRTSDAGWTAYLADAEGAVRGVCSSGRPRDIVAARRALTGHPSGRPAARALVGA